MKINDQLPILPRCVKRLVPYHKTNQALINEVPDFYLKDICYLSACPVGRPDTIKIKMMVEVFKTNVSDSLNANMVIYQIHKCFAHYTANFDLEDCDNILRIKYANGIVESSAVIKILKDFGFHAEVLPDEIKLMAS